MFVIANTPVTRGGYRSRMKLPPEVQETIPTQDVTVTGTGPRLAAAIDNARHHGITTPLTDHLGQLIAVIAPPEEQAA